MPVAEGLVMTFGGKLKELREAAGMSQPQLAERCGLPLGTLRGWEQDRREPTWRAFCTIVKALGVEMDAFSGCDGFPLSQED